MELPPGWRGYGAKDHIEHPETPPRQAEVERIAREQAEPADRQRALLPFEQLLPERFRGANARFAGADDD